MRSLTWLIAGVILILVVVLFFLPQFGINVFG